MPVLFIAAFLDKDLLSTLCSGIKNRGFSFGTAQPFDETHSR